MEKILAPSILAADIMRLGEQIEAVKNAGAKYLHIDVMDGMFVPALSYGMCVVESIRKFLRYGSGRAPDDRRTGTACGSVCKSRRRYYYDPSGSLCRRA